MRQLGELVPHIVRRHSKRVAIAFGVLALFAALSATQVRIDSSVEGLMQVGDPERAENRALKSEFSNDEVVVVAFDLGHPFEADDLFKLNRISDAIRNIAGVEEVLDLSSIEDVRGDAGSLDASALVDLETVHQDLGSIRNRVQGHRLYHRTLVSEDQAVLALLVVFAPPAGNKEESRAATAAILALIDEAAHPWVAHASGYPVNEYEADRIARRDLLLLTPPAYLSILLVVFLAFRSRAALALVTVLVVWSELCMAAWLALSGTPINIVTSAVPPILLATSAAYGIYFLGLLQKVSDESEPGVAVIGLMMRPVLLSSISTCAGFLSLLFFDVQAIRELGGALSAGILAAALGTLVLLPAICHLYQIHLDHTRLVALERLSRWGVRFSQRPILTVTIAFALLLLAIPGIARIELDSDPMRYFSAKGPHSAADRFIQERLAGTGVVNVLLRSTAPGDILDPSVMRYADRVIREVERSPIVDQTVSFLDYVYLMDAALRPGEAPRTVLPTSELLAQYLLVYEVGGDPGDYRHYINHERSALNILIRTNTLASSEILSLRDSILAVERGDDSAVDAIELRVLGSLTLLVKAMDRIVSGMMEGLAVALAVIFCVLVLGLRSVRLAFIATLPNVAPIILLGGLLGWMGIPLSVGTSVVGCVALGLAVDDTAHVMGHARRDQPLYETFRVVGPPIILTTLSLGLGFGFLAGSEFEPVSILGLATVVTLTAALLFDLLVLPSLLVLVGFEAGPEPKDLVLAGGAEAGIEASKPNAAMRTRE